MRTLCSAAALAVTGTLTVGCSAPHAPKPRAAQPVQTQLVAAMPDEPEARYSASIEAYEQVPLAFKASGYVVDLLQRRGPDGRLRVAQPGDRIVKGTVLGRVRDDDYRERVNEGRAKLAEGQASLTKAKLDLERARTLFAAESLTKPDLDSAQASFDAAEARVAAARAEVELAVSALGDCTLVAPATGVILERHIETGTLASAGTVAFVVGDLSSVKARFGVPDSIVHTLDVGHALAVMVEATGATPFGGRVTAIAPAADPQSRVFDVEVTIPNADGRLRPGMIGTVRVGGAAERRAALAPAVPSVPLTAIVRSETGAGEFAVLVVERQASVDVARRRRVELGAVSGNAIAVKKGVALGERVVVTGATLLLDGDAVRVLP